MIDSLPVLHAVALRVQWADRDLDGVLAQVAHVDTLQSARDIIVALLLSGDLPVDLMRRILSREVLVE